MFLITFLVAASFHACLKAFSVAKTSILSPKDGDTDPGWAPFDNSNGELLTGAMDSLLLAAKALALPVVGILSSKFSLKALLLIGCAGASLSCAMIGMAYYLEFHTIFYFSVCFILSGIFQASAFPLCAAIIVNWFPSRIIGTVLGAWACSASIGNIIGNFLGSIGLQVNWGLTDVKEEGHNWAWAIFVNALLLAACFVLAIPCLQSNPSDEDIKDEAVEDYSNKYASDVSSFDDSFGDANTFARRGYAYDGRDKHDKSLDEQTTPATLKDVLAVKGRIPTSKPRSLFCSLIILPLTIIFTTGVVMYAFCIFFVKFTVYVLLLWLPVILSEHANFSDVEVTVLVVDDRA